MTDSVLGYRLQEICAIMQRGLHAVKSALQRGRLHLRQLANVPDPKPVRHLSAAEESLLRKYVDLFNARKFNALRELLADEVRLEVVNKERNYGKAEVSGYGKYDRQSDWSLAAGFVEGRPGVIVLNRADGAEAPFYFVLLTWEEGRIVSIRDFRYARYACEDAEMETIT